MNENICSEECGIFMSNFDFNENIQVKNVQLSLF